ncbi:MAG: WD40-repeat-containing domain protein [Olpidium bornovanus]|uniref:WD40-repeat-containing domain protein n=1 Tax=Olpidium bornovanus TaxID=278681 RepID=A0A8H8DIW9_9FUNG|nr:MAG: WD40-repeat-containing domain protein [Olpidium bornovanus]
MKFSKDGKYLSTGGQDTVVRVWCLVCEGEPDSAAAPAAATPTDPETPRTVSSTAPSSRLRTVSSSTTSSGNYWKTNDQGFRPIPLREYRGHTAAVLDLSWTARALKDGRLRAETGPSCPGLWKTRLWHVTRQECLCCFQHPDFVTAITFHPRDDRFFLSGSLDCKLRLWNIPDKKVTCWNESPENLITAVGFTLDGKIAVAGSYVGLCMFYETEVSHAFMCCSMFRSRIENAIGMRPALVIVLGFFLLNVCNFGTP